MPFTQTAPCHRPRTHSARFRDPQHRQPEAVRARAGLLPLARALTWLGGLMLCATSHAQTSPFHIPLWENGPPGAVATDVKEEFTPRGGAIQVSFPMMAVYLPPRETATGMALVVCPGGSYREVGFFQSGMGVPGYFLPKGIAVIVLKYRTRPPSTDVAADALQDARRAMRLVRHHATVWGVDTKRIGMVGSSAGAHLVLNLATHADDGRPADADPVERQGCRPDFLGLLCPWPNAQPIEDFPIGRETPPVFVCSARDDVVAPTSFAEEIAAACQRAGVSSRLWVLEKGGHTAFRIGGRGEGSRWPDEFQAWLQTLFPGTPARTENRPPHGGNRS